MAPVVLSYDQSQPGKIKIAWDAPYNNSDAITQYQIKIYGYPGLTNNTFVQRQYFETVECNATIDPVFSQRQCYVSMSTLRAEPFALQLGQHVHVIARAMNNFGWSEYS